MPRRCAGRGVLSFGLGALIAANPVSGQTPPSEFQFGVKSTFGVSDNIRRSPTEEISELIAGIGIVGSWEKEQGRFRGEAEYDVSYYTYLDDTFDDQVFGGLNLFAEYDLIEDRLTWMVQENFGQADIDPFTSSNPGNIENVNYFTTGPDLKLRFGERTYTVVGGRYSNIAYERTRGDNERFEGTISLRRELSESTTLSLNGSQERVEYKYVPPGSNFDRQEAYLGLSLEGRRTNLVVTGGMTWLHDRGETFDGPLWRVALSRQVGSYSTISLHGGSEFSDAGDVFRYGQTVGGGGFDNPADTLAVPDPFERDYASVGWNTEKDRTEVSLHLNWSDESYQTFTEFDRELYGLRAELAHALTQRTRLTGVVYGSHEEFRAGFEEDEWRFDLVYGWHVARPLYVDFTYSRFFREDSRISGTAIENMFFASLTYNFAQ